MTVKAKPDGYHTITPYLVVDGARKLMSFLEKAFNANEAHDCLMMGEKVGHAELQIGDSKIMISDASEQHPAHPSVIYMYVENVDQVYKTALEVGATSITPPADMFYGDRHAGIVDPTGNKWWIATHIEDLTAEEIKVRGEQFKKEMVGCK